MSANRYYVDRPNVTPAGLLVTSAAAAATALAVGAVVGFVDYYDPFRVFAFLGVVGGGTLVGSVVARVARSQRLHHPLLRNALGLVAGLLACYALWAACTFAVMQKYDSTEISSFASPWSILQTMFYLSENPRWTVAGFPTGVARHLLYVLEIALLVFCTWSTAREGDTPFCSDSGDWADVLEDVALLATPADENAFRLALERNQYDPLRTLRHEGIDEADCYHVTLFVDPGQGEENYLTVQHVRESDGTEQDVVRLLRVPRSVVASLQEPVADRSQRMPVPTADGESSSHGNEATPDDSAVTELV